MSFQTRTNLKNQSIIKRFNLICNNHILAITCAAHDAIANGDTITYSTTETDSKYEFDTIATFTCNAGFSLKETVTVKCKGGSDDKGWTYADNKKPTCEGLLIFS